jgi:cell division septum initiation protein DivIVA
MEREIIQLKIKLEQEQNEKSILEEKIKELTEQLQKYTNSKRHIRYYENHKDEVKERAKTYMEKVKEQNPDKLKEWRKTAYQNRKAKLKAQKEVITV